MRKKVLLVDSTQLEHAPYLKYYVDAFQKYNIDYDIFTWDKSCNAPTTKSDHIITIHQTVRPLGIRKLLKFFPVALKLRRYLTTGEYTHFISINTIWALFCTDILLSRKIRFFVDVRDYKGEDHRIRNFLCEFLLPKAEHVALSSPGFARFLPQGIDYLHAHNITEGIASWEQASQLDKDVLHIFYCGYLHSDRENEALLRSCVHSQRYFLDFFGAVSPWCHFFDSQIFKDHGNRYRYHGSYNNENKPKIYTGGDIINCLYENYGPLKYALPNRLYDCLLYKKPLLVNKGTFIADIVNEYHLGLVVDCEHDDIVEKLDSYCEHYDANLLTDNCNKLLDKCRREQEVFLQSVAHFLM